MSPDPAVESLLTERYRRELKREVRYAIVATLGEHGYTSQATKDVMLDARDDYDDRITELAEAYLRRLAAPTPEPTNTPYGWKTVTPGAYRDNLTLAPLPGGGKPAPNPAHTAEVVLELTEAPGEVVPVPTPTMVPIPLTYPERPFVFASIVAKVRVAELYPLRGSSESGLAPTRDPNLPPRHSQPTLEKEVFAPIWLELVEIYKSPEQSQSLAGVVVHQYAGTVADYGGLPADAIPGHAVDPATLSVGDTAMVFLSPIGHRDRYVDNYVAAIAAEMSTQAALIEAVHVDEWYSYIDGSAVSLRGGDLPIGELESRIAAALLE